MEARIRVKTGTVAPEIGREAAEALGAAMREALGGDGSPEAEVLAVLDDGEAADGAGPRSLRIRVDFLSGGRLILEETEEGREGWTRLIGRMASRLAKGLERELDRRWERTAA